jgi:hypothetical protein
MKNILSVENSMFFDELIYGELKKIIFFRSVECFWIRRNNQINPKSLECDWYQTKTCKKSIGSMNQMHIKAILTKKN